MAEVELPGPLAERVEGVTRRVIAGIRPEHFEDAALVGEAAGRGVTFDATIEVIEWMGSELYAYFCVESGDTEDIEGLARELETADPTRGGTLQVVARLDAASGARRGEGLETWIDAGRIHLFDPESGENLTAGAMDVDRRHARDEQPERV
jgi:multiple sugar transport system ATP-binding protein